MASTDFFDDDLVKHRASPKRFKAGPGDEPATAPPGSTEAPPRPVSDFNLTRMARHKDQMEESMAMAAQELERLKQRQQNLEREKQHLENLRNRQSEYERGKREMLEHLNQSLISLEKEELNAEKLLEMVTSTRQRCRTWLAELESLDEESWPEEQFREELAKSLAKIEDIRMEYNKALAKIEALSKEEKKATSGYQPVIFDESRQMAMEEKGFGHWLKVGFAVSLPLIFTVIMLWLLYYMHSIGML